MGFSNDIYKTVLEKKRIELQRDEALREKLKAQLYSDFPRVKEIDNELSKIGMECVKAAFSGNHTLLSSLKDESLKLQNERNALVCDKYLVPFRCEKCKDSGYFEGKYCDCVESEARNQAFSTLSSVAPFDKCTFDSFSLDYYPEKSESKISPKLRMEKTVKYLEKYIDSFPSGENLLFVGGAGLGKTHLSIAVANKIIEKGYSVFYASSEHLFSHLEQERFGKSFLEGSYFDAVENCDLLILDDLGTEFLSQFCKSSLYDIINTRELKNKSTIISTNLFMDEIANRYTPRISSRLIGCYTSLLFDGNDIRQIKSMK